MHGLIQLAGFICFTEVALVLRNSPFAEGANCQSVDGKWYNKLGSELSLRHDAGFLSGYFIHAGETGISKSKNYSLHGAIPYLAEGATIGFSVSFEEGESTSAWTGQCHVCADDGVETLITTWVRRHKVNTCEEKWKSTFIGQDFFTRDKPVGMDAGTPNQDLPTDTTEETGAVDEKCSDITGIWYNRLGSEVILSQDKQGLITGEYRTAVERSEGAAGKSHSTVYGFRDYGKRNATMSFFVVWNNGTSITGWVGQCHVCGVNASEMIETTWLLRGRQKSCGDNWKSTYHGEGTFTRYEQTDGPRKATGKHTPDRPKKQDPEKASDCTCAATWLQVYHSLYAVAFFFAACLNSF